MAGRLVPTPHRPVPLNRARLGALFPEGHPQPGVPLPPFRPAGWPITGERGALNTWQQHRIARLVVQKLFGTVTGKRLGILVLLLRPTPTTPRGAAIRICRDLLEEGPWPSTIRRGVRTDCADLQDEIHSRMFLVEPAVGQGWQH